ncbi:MAG: hypothetical protein ABIL17_08550 [candidate division WOR-3 bacterium]
MRVRILDMVFVVIIMLWTLWFLFKPTQSNIKIVYVRDTVYIHDTIYLNSAFLFSAKRCDSLYLSSSSSFTTSRTFTQALTMNTNTQTQRFGIGAGIGYDFKDRHAYYYILGEYVLKDYFSIGAYAGNKQVGIYGKVRF